VFDTSTWPVTFIVAGTALSQRITPLIFVLIVVYAGELVWKEREDGVDGITDATPVPRAAEVAGRFLALVAVLLVIQTATVLGGVLIQAFQGYYRFEPGLYLRVVFGLDLAGYVLTAALVMTIHIVVNHKNLGHLVSVLAIGFIMFSGALGIRHHLLVYSSGPGWTYSDMNGFGPFVAANTYLPPIPPTTASRSSASREVGSITSPRWWWGWNPWRWPHATSTRSGW
jgi:ABC-type transport system involved in multi-copper enzyme maturation permease subunit